MAGSATGKEGGGSSRPLDPLLGRVVGGRFRVLDLIARGGMGKVYRAEQEPLGRLCALKVLHPREEEEDDPEFQKRFLLEAATAAQLTHPNTVTIFDYGRDGEIYYIAMEYIQGRTLYRVLREDGPLEEPRVVRILSQVCRSLREAHQHGVIHRDMKPGNLVLVDTADEADTVKVLDFGLVKRVDGDSQEDLTQEGMFMGSPKYMAPEQILGNPVSPATDVYALGVVAYELVCGKPPFDDGTSVKTMMAHLHAVLPPLRERMGDRPLSVEFEAIVRRCLAKEPVERFESMDALLRTLQLIDGTPLTDSLGGPKVWAVTATGRERLLAKVDPPTAGTTPGDPTASEAFGGEATTNDPLLGPHRAEAAPAADEAARLSSGALAVGGRPDDSRAGASARLAAVPRRAAVALVAVAAASLVALVAVIAGVRDGERPAASRAATSGGPRSPSRSPSPDDAASAASPPTTSPLASAKTPASGAQPAPNAPRAVAPTPSADSPSSTPAAGGTSTAANRKGDLPRGYKASPY